MKSDAGVAKMPNMAPLVVAVVVTYNRKELLQRCLKSITGGEQQPALTIVWDNHSSDGTLAMLEAEGWLARDDLKVLSSAINLGGAGGFHGAINYALTLQPRWIWIMDDDSLPDHRALAMLLRAAEQPWRRPPVLLASKVLWTDANRHPMNRCKPLRSARREGVLRPIRACSFVSCLVRAERVHEVGLPIAAFQLWLDDVEFTHRLVRGRPALAVETSLVTHATLTATSTLNAPPDRALLNTRNWRWMMRSPLAFSHSERPLLWLRFVYTCALILWNSPHKRTMAAALWRGWRRGGRPCP